MRYVHSLVFASVLSFVGASCGGDSNNNNNNNNNNSDDGGETNFAASVSSVQPTSAYTGRTIDVEISGNATAWTSGTTVNFGAGITVNKITVASPTALLANVTIAPTAAAGTRDISVTTSGSALSFKGAFSVGSPIDVSLTGTPAQGSLSVLHITNRDLAALFDATTTGDGFTTPIEYPNITITTGTGVTAIVSSVTQFAIDATLAVDVTATAGANDIEVISGPAGGTQTHYVLTKAVTVTARTATPLAATQQGTATGFDTLLYTFTPTSGTQVEQLATSAAAGAASAIYLLPASGKWTDLISASATSLFVSTTPSVFYAVIWDNSGVGGNATTTYSQTAATTAAESTSNETSAHAQVVTSGTLVQNASLTDINDQDWYSIVVTGTTHTLHVVTLAGDPQTDTIISVYGPNSATTLVGASPDQTYQEDFTTGVLAAGTYYVNITASPMFSATQSHYQALFVIQ